MFNRNEYIISLCPDNLKADMREALSKFSYPQVFQTGSMSSDFKLDTDALKFGWTRELQQHYHNALSDSRDY